MALSPQDALAAKAVFGLEPRVNTRATCCSEVLSILQCRWQAVRSKVCQRPGLALLSADQIHFSAGHSAFCDFCRKVPVAMWAQM